jgi:hypothetical protein
MPNTSAIANAMPNNIGFTTKPPLPSSRPFPHRITHLDRKNKNHTRCDNTTITIRRAHL